MNKNPALKTFMSAVCILFIMLIVTGALTYIIPNGEFDAQTMTYKELETRGIPIIDWILAPILVLASDSGTLVIAIILFLLIVAGSINVLKETKLIEGIVVTVAKKFSKNEFLLLSILSFVFMSLGAFIGIFEEVVPLIPLVIMLSSNMGWDDMTGLGISLLATGLGFAAAVSNPFTIGVAQELAGLPMFSGALLRLLVFICVYIILIAFLYKHMKKNRVGQVKAELSENNDVPKKAYSFFTILMVIMLVFIAISPFVSIFRDLSIPIIGLIFLIAAVGVGIIIKGNFKWVAKTFGSGIKDMLPAILLILLATGIKEVMTKGHILDTVLYWVSRNISSLSPLVALIASFILVMILNFFVGSGSAKAFILMPLLMPIMDMLGVGRQLGILAFQFGDGFSNVLYPTNAVVLVSLGLAKVSFGKWFKFILPIQIVLFIVSLAFIALGYFVGYGL